jgi:hypothetical protein
MCFIYSAHVFSRCRIGCYIKAREIIAWEPTSLPDITRVCARNKLCATEESLGVQKRDL